MQCFRIFTVAKKFMDKGGGVSRFSVEKFFSHSAENFLRGIFYRFINFRYRKMLRIKERGEHQDFPPKNFCFIVPNISYGNHFVQCFRIFTVAEKFIDKGGGVSRFSVEKSFSHSAENFLRGIFYRFINFRYRKLLGIREGGNTIFRRKNFVSQCRKIS